MTRLASLGAIVTSGLAGQDKDPHLTYAVSGESRDVVQARIVVMDANMVPCAEGLQRAIIGRQQVS